VSAVLALTALTAVVPRDLVPWMVRSSVAQFGQAEIEGRSDLFDARHDHPSLGRRDSTPQIQDPVLVLRMLSGQDHQEIRVRRRVHTRPPPADELRFDGQPFPGGSGRRHQQNSGPGHGRS
jgi:hypothetical protein